MMRSLHVPRRSFPSLAVAIGCALLGPVDVVRGAISRVDVDPVAPIEGEAVKFTIQGEAPNPCYSPHWSEPDTGVEGSVITLVYSLDYEAPPGVSCVQVIVPFTLEFTFEDGFEAGTYELRVTERLRHPQLPPQSTTLEYTLRVAAGGSGVTAERSGWGAIKALYAAAADGR